MRSRTVRRALALACAVFSAMGSFALTRGSHLAEVPLLELPAVAAARRPAGPRASETRAAVLRRDAEAIEAECRRAADGDWEKWRRQTVNHRAALKHRIDTLPPFPELDPIHPINSFGQMRLNLQGRDGFPLLEPEAGFHLRHLYDASTLDTFRRERPVVAVDRWLAEKGIDLIFVPVPKMTEVYVEHFLDACPPDGVVAPHLRRMLLELLNEDVEVVDGWSVFRPVREPDPDYLFNSGETHWAPRGQRVMAREVADRIARYDFGRQARQARPGVQSRVAPYQLPGRLLLVPEQLAIARAGQATTQVEVRTLDGKPVPDDPASPVLLIGNSYARGFREQLVRESNQLINSCIANDMTTEVFADLLREPKLLERVRVVVWVTTEQHLTRFRALPPPIAAALRLPEK